MPCDIETVLEEGVDYEVDLAGGRVRFLSTGALGAIINEDTTCGVKVTACCQECEFPEDMSCDYSCYFHDGYDTVMQEGANNYRSDDEKMIKRVIVEAEPLAQTTPSRLETSVGYAATPSCFTWKELPDKPFECQTSKTPEQHAAQGTRPDGNFNYPSWNRGIYISTRFRISGVGGGGTFSGLHKMIKGWGQADSP